MGRKKIKIERIVASKNRQVTFNKRKVGLMKKAMELSILCDCVIGVIIMCDGKLYTYSSSHMDEVMAHYQRYDGPYEGLDNNDVSSSSSSTAHRHSTQGTAGALCAHSFCPRLSLRSVGRAPSWQGFFVPSGHSQAQGVGRAERRGGRRV